MNIFSAIASLGSHSASAAATSHTPPSVTGVVLFVTLVGIVVSFAMALLIKGLHLGIQRITTEDAQ